MPNDIVYTPDEVAYDIVSHFAPTGVILDPCSGDGAFLRHLPAGAEWCEVSKGRDFFQWNRRVDWIIGNPPYSNFKTWMEHSLSLADNVCYLVPLYKAWSSLQVVEYTNVYGGIKEVYVVGSGSDIGWQIGFPVGAVHWNKGYTGTTVIGWRASWKRKRRRKTA